MRSAVWCGVIILFAPIIGNAASFDCDKASSAVEKMICTDASVSKLDDELGQAYKDRMQDEMQAESTRQAQRQWLKERNRCSDVVCLKHAYRTRLSTLMAPEESSASQKASKSTDHSAGTAAFDFSITRGEEIEMCRDYVKNLKAAAPTEAALACGVAIRPGMDQLGLPNWEELEIDDHWEVVYEIERRTDYYFNSALTQAAWRKDFESRISSGAIKPRLRRIYMRLVEDKPVLPLYGYARDGTRTENCKKDFAEGGDSGRGFLGDMIFIVDESKKVLSEILTGRPNYRETESIFESRQQHLSFTYKSTLFFQRTSGPINSSVFEGYVIWIYGASIPDVVAPNRELYSYSAAQVCEVHATRKVSARP